MWLIAALCAVFYFVFDPLTVSFMPGCVFRRLTGLNCACCGSQRMLHALMHGDLAGAFHANAFVTLMLPVIAFLLWLKTRQSLLPRLYKKIYSPALIIVTVISLVAWMIVRNILKI